MRWPSDDRLRAYNRSLLVFIVIVNGFLLISPLWPAVTFAFETRLTKPVKITSESLTVASQIDTSYNHLIIPSMQLDSPILDGESEQTVHRGIWRRPQTATPGEGSNTVLVGHRYTYSGVSVFYHLDVVRPGDDIIAVYGGKVYIYRVTDSRTVQPTEVEVEAPTQEEKLTLYTCTPLGSLRNRLVITAKLERTL